MKRYLPAIGIVLLAAILLLLLWLVTAPRKPLPIRASQSPQAALSLSPQTNGPVAASTDDPPAAAATSAGDDAPPNDDLVPTHRPSGPARTSLAEATGPEVGPGLTPGIVLENMRGAVRDYGSRFGGNPFGINREITSRLNGANPGHVVFLKTEDGLRIDDRGELIDNWGTPFFFHQISGAEMEIRSAGPDRKMWTKDDLVTR
jgi:hypothetical protein